MSDIRTIILASGSPRRREILAKTGLKFKVDMSNYQEKLEPGLKPHDIARLLSSEKARHVAHRYRNVLVIAADTIVVFKGSLFGKPQNKEQAKEMLKTLSGKAHSVITGFTIIDTATKKELTTSVESKVFFKRLSPNEIAAYIRSGEPLDKAGAYAVQGLGAVLIKRIEGDFFNVMGLPLHSLTESLKKFGIKVLNH
ncbi:MAG: Septum formation protein Maf [Nitrospirae bacterium]|jgi:septum formation protein|nr:Septum formation protein Maf [Nitrospirota bacterium]